MQGLDPTVALSTKVRYISHGASMMITKMIWDGGEKSDNKSLS